MSIAKTMKSGARSLAASPVSALPLAVGAVLSAAFLFTTPVMAQDAPDFSIDFDDVVAIIGGRESSAGRFPSTAALLRVSPTQNLFQRQFCAGTAISDNYILTAAHCMFGAFGELEPDEVLIAGNFIDLQNESPAEIEVEQIFVHPAYDNFSEAAEHDVAILRTVEPHNITPITLFNGDSRALGGIDAFIVGWGVVQQPQFAGDTNRFPTVLNEAVVPVTDFNTCNRVYGGQLGDPHLCAGFEEGGIDSCQGDSGGPLMISDGAQLIQIGVTSFGNGCAQPDAYGVYSNIEVYESFISNIVPEPSNGNRMFEAPEQFAGASLPNGGDEEEDEETLFGLGASGHGLLALLMFGSGVRLTRGARRLHRGVQRVPARLAPKVNEVTAVSVVVAACLGSGCVTDLPASTGESLNQTGSRSSVVAAKFDETSLVKVSSEHGNLPMFDGVSLAEKRAPAIQTATRQYGVEPACTGRKVAPRTSKRADFYERCDFTGFATEFKGGTVRAVTYHFMSNRIVQIDATLHAPAFALAPVANNLDEILGKSEFSTGQTGASAGSGSLPQAIYHWSDPDVAYARLMTEAGADTESFLLSIQHPRFADVIDELASL